VDVLVADQSAAGPTKRINRLVVGDVDQSVRKTKDLTVDAVVDLREKKTKTSQLVVVMVVDPKERRRVKELWMRTWLWI